MMSVMGKHVSIGIAAAVMVIANTAHRVDAAPAAEIVVAIRYLQAEGTSHAHLYLYREDGKLLRQLTKVEKGQDREPVFAPDGEMIVFTRDLGKDVKEWWSIEPRGGGLKQLKVAPEWYASGKSSPYFTNRTPENWPEGERIPGSPGMEGDEPSRFRAPDGSVELVLGEVKGGEENGVDGMGHGADYLLRDLKTGKDTRMGDLPGFEGLWDILHGTIDAKEFFLFQGSLRLAFFGLHLDSSAGDTSYALDLNKRRLVRLSPAWAAPIPLPGESAFLTLSYERYLPIPGSSKNENCSFMERWDTDFNKVRYAKPDTAPICYGASMYRPGKTPVVVTIREE